MWQTFLLLPWWPFCCQKDFVSFPVQKEIYYKFTILGKTFVLWNHFRKRQWILLTSRVWRAATARESPAVATRAFLAFSFLATFTPVVEKALREAEEATRRQLWRTAELNMVNIYIYLLRKVKSDGEVQ